MMTPSMSAQPCPDNALLGALIDGTLAEQARAQVVAHVDTCARCRSRVSEWLARAPPAETIASAVTDLPGEGATIARRYTLGRMLGRGGMGVVYDAIQLDLGRPVAIKLLPPTADPIATSRFAREARTLAQLAHPNIVQIFDYGTDMGTAYVVMERLEGRPLSAALRADGPFEVGRVVRLATEMLRALAVTHRAGVVHRDIKPANVFLLQGDGVKLLDFGIASTNDGSPRLTQTGTTIGTPAYMAPEQLLAGTVDGRTDLYAVGVFMFEMLTGRRPFQGASSTQVVAQILVGGAPRVDSFRPGIPSGLADVIARALARDPAARFADAEAFVEALGSCRDATGARPSFASAALPSTYAVTASAALQVAPTRDMTAPMPPALAAAAAGPAPAPARSWVAAILGVIAALLLGLMVVGAFVAFRLTGANAGGATALDASAPSDGAAVPPRASASSNVVSTAPLGKAPVRPGTSPAAASALATSPSCSCVNVAGGPVCVAPRMPDCSCGIPGTLTPLCPQPWSSSGRCPVGSGLGGSAYSAFGRRHEDACSGFQQATTRPADGGPPVTTSSTTQVAGKLDCNFCSGPGDRFAGVNGARCRGTTNSSASPDDIREGTVVCK